MNEIRNIKVTIEEKNLIINNGADKLPLNPTSQGFSGQSVRKQLSQAVTGARGSVLALMIEKFSIIEDFSNTVLLVEVKVVGDDLTFIYADGREFKFPLDVITNGLVKFVNDKAPDENGHVVINIDDISELRDFITSTTAELFRIDFEFEKHKNDTDNPHEVTAEQIDTYVKTVIDNKDADTLQQAKDYTYSQVEIDNKDIAIMNKANDLENDKVDKTTTIIGLDLQDNILIGEFRTALGNATQSVAGLLSAEDKTHLDGLVTLLETSDGNNVVDTIGEILDIFQNYPEGADLVTVLQGKVDKVEGKGLSTNDLTDILKDNYDVAYTHSQVKNDNPHEVKFSELLQKPTTRDGYGITDVYTKPETYTQLEINNLLDNLSAVKGLKTTLLTPTELANGNTISTNLLTNNGSYVVFTATNTSTGEIDSDTVPVSTIKTGKKFVFFDNQEIVFTIGETNSTFETSEDITLKINLLYLDDENVQAIGVDFDGSLTNYLLTQTNVQKAIEKLDEELKTTKDNLGGVNVQSDWAQTTTTADDYIKNKPTIPSKVSDLTNDTGYITGYTETDPIFTAWDKSTGISITKSQVSDLIEATQALSGLMSATDKQRLDALHALLEEDTANNVVDSINEVLAIFNNYPEGADLVTALAGKVDKTSIIDNLTTNDATKVLSAKQGKVLNDTLGNIDAILDSILGV